MTVEIDRNLIVFNNVDVKLLEKSINKYTITAKYWNLNNKPKGFSLFRITPNKLSNLLNYLELTADQLIGQEFNKYEIMYVFIQVSDEGGWNIKGIIEDIEDIEFIEFMSS